MTRAQIAYHADFVIFPFLVAGLIWWQGISALWLATIPAGLVTWTLVEYILHRFVFHRIPVIRDVHDQHHVNPKSFSGIAPSLVTLPIAAAVIFGAQTLLGDQGFAVGFIVGYLIYGAVHEIFHHVHLRIGHWMVPARTRHAMHHRGLEANFGVTTPVWDRMFRTYISHRHAWT